MNDEQYKQVKAAVKWWLEADVHNLIEDGEWEYNYDIQGIRADCRCPLGAYCELNRKNPNPTNAETLLETTADCIEGFVRGFDDAPAGAYTNDWYTNDWYEAGSRLRRELIEEGVL